MMLHGRELIRVLTLSVLVAPGVAVAQGKAVVLDELLHSGSLPPRRGGLCHGRCRSPPERHA